MEEGWREQATCKSVGTHLFYAEGAALGQDSKEAKEVCRGCPVSTYCAIASVGERHGVWAGRTPAERTRLRTVTNLAFHASRDEAMEARKMHDLSDHAWFLQDPVSVFIRAFGIQAARTWLGAEVRHGQERTA